MLYVIFPILLARLNFISASTVISIYADVCKDTAFFTKTFPWIIDHIGGEIAVDFHMVGSGRYGVPQMCVLEALRTNTFLQAQYLKCEAEGNPSELCLCETGIDREAFKHCVATRGNLASQASAKFAQLGVEVTPIIELGPKSTVFGVEDTWYLKKICTIFGENLPRGCIQPFSCDRNQTDVNFSKKAIAHFDRCCEKEWAACFDNPPVVTPKPLDN